MSQETTQDKSIVNAHPTKGLFISILIRDVTLRDAIGDLVDNSVDGALRLRPEGDYKGLKVHIELNAQQGYFKITDNCGGIPVSVARDYAFRFGRPENVATIGHSVGVFGIGMKRALFRLGKWFRVESVAQDSSFVMEVDVEKWKNGIIDETNTSGDKEQEKWEFKFRDFNENEEHPEETRGTIITVTHLHPEVLESFRLENDVAKLVEELQREHLYSIDKGLEITVNGKRLAAPELKLLVSDDFKTAYWENLAGPVKVRIYAGVSEQEKYGPNGGWYIFCNKRLVLGPDQTKSTGWGAEKPCRIPDYHSQFYRFRGYVFLDAEDPRDLPWNTAKTNMELDSPVYRTVLQQMIVLMDSVIDFLNQLHYEKQHYKNERINETPLQNAIERAKPLSLNQVMTQTVYLSKEKFVAPERAKPVRPQPSEVWIRYSITQQEYDFVKDYFVVDKPSEIGRKIFEYFFQREIED